jgi:hypothetical protein
MVDFWRARCGCSPDNNDTSRRDGGMALVSTSEQYDLKPCPGVRRRVGKSTVERKRGMSYRI